MAEDKATNTDEAGEAEAPKSKKLLFVGIGAAVVLLLAGGGGFLFLRGGEQAADAADESAAANVEEALEAEVDPHGSPAFEAHASSGSEQATFKLEPFIVNISDRDRDRYLKLKAELALGSPAVADALGSRLPEVRDLVISLLSSKSFEEVRTIEGKNFLREEIIVRLNALIGTGAVRKIFFTEFVVQ